MVINNSNNNVKFISYTGKYPNLCNGVLTLEICGEKVTFEKPFWISGGHCVHTYGILKGEWEIDYNAIPEKYRKYAYEIDEVFNDNVDHGCCGGCL